MISKKYHMAAAENRVYVGERQGKSGDPLCVNGFLTDSDTYEHRPWIYEPMSTVRNIPDLLYVKHSSVLKPC